MRHLPCVGGIALVLATASLAFGQGPPPPIAPEVITRDASRQATVRAIRLDRPLTMDGRLDEPVYAREKAISDFIQTLPNNNAEPSEKTEAWVMFDETNIYVAARCWDSEPPERWIANEMRRDQGQIRQNDHFGVMLDTFHDKRNGYVFYSNPIGGRMDLTEADEGNSNSDWNPVWNVRTARFEGGWTIEMAIPFKSLRYVSGVSQSWGIQMRRAMRRRNEWAHLTPLPVAMGGGQGFFRISAAATLVGLDLPAASRNIELKPYAISRLTTDRGGNPPINNDFNPDAGIDAKYGITANLTADFTAHTDFAQVEVDEQQVNLTRFSLQFPEKRDFFLEGRGIFGFASFPTTGGGGGGQNTTSNTPVLFYSRRIGLNGNRVVPIEFGERLTGKLGRMSVGAINIETAEDDTAKVPTPATNFTVLRVKRDMFRRSSVGALFTNRSESVVTPGTQNQTYGADAVFSFFSDLSLGGYYARTATTKPDTDGPQDDESYQVRAEYSPDTYGAQFEYLKVGHDFNPEVGFVRRPDAKRTFGLLRYSPRPKRIKGVRQFIVNGSYEYIENSFTGELETTQGTGFFSLERQNSDVFSVEANASYDLIAKPFEVARDTDIPVGTYNYNDALFRYSFGQQRRASGAISWQVGQFYDGHISALNVSGARLAVTRQLSLEPSLSVNRVTLPYANFTTSVLRARTDYAFSPRMFVSTLLQYGSNERAFSSNLRFRWEYQPGSEIFVVYTDERNTETIGFPFLKNRAFVVKVNRLFRF